MLHFVGTYEYVVTLCTKTADCYTGGDAHRWAETTSVKSLLCRAQAGTGGHRRAQAGTGGHLYCTINIPNIKGSTSSAV